MQRALVRTGCVLELGVHGEGGRPAPAPACASSASPARAPPPCAHPVSPCPQPEACRTLAPERDKPAKHCSIQLPDGTACVVLVRAGLSIKDVLAGLCERHGINGAAVDLFLVGGDKVRLRDLGPFSGGRLPCGDPAGGEPARPHLSTSPAGSLPPLPEPHPGAWPGCALPLRAPQPRCAPRGCAPRGCAPRSWLPTAVRPAPADVPLGFFHVLEASGAASGQ